MGAQLFACLDQLVKSVSIAKKSTPTSIDKKKKKDVELKR